MSEIEDECLTSIVEAMVNWLRHRWTTKGLGVLKTGGHDEEWHQVQRAFVYLVYGGSDYAFSRL